jgi:hypothetical protein
MYIGAMILAVSGAIAIYLNFQGARCLSDLALVDRSVTTPGQLQEMERNCSIVTNSYVYSTYGVAAGIVLIVVGFMKKRKDNAS